MKKFNNQFCMAKSQIQCRAAKRRRQHHSMNQRKGARPNEHRTLGESVFRPIHSDLMIQKKLAGPPPE